MNLEYFPMSEPPEFRSEGSHLTASGVAMRYGAKSKPINGKFREVFQPGAFTKTIAEQDIYSHNEHAGPYLARTSNGTLRLVDGRSELGYEIDLPDTTAGRDTAALLERRDIKGASIGFRAIPGAVKWTVEDGMALRSVAEAKLARVDLTVAPYYDSTSAELALRSLAEEKGVEVRSLLDADAVADLISSPEDDPDEERSEEERRETPTLVRVRIAHLYL